MFFFNLGTVDLNATGLNCSYQLICSLCLIRCQTFKVKKLGFKWLILRNCLSLFLFSESFISSFIFEAEIAVPVFQLHWVDTPNSYIVQGSVYFMNYPVKSNPLIPLNILYWFKLSRLIFVSEVGSQDKEILIS